MSTPTGSDSQNNQSTNSDSSSSDPPFSKVLVLIPKLMLAEPCHQNVSNQAEENVAISSLRRSSSNEEMSQNNSDPKKSKPPTKKQFFSIVKLFGGGGDDDDPFGTPKSPAATPVDPDLSLASVGGLEDHINYLKRAVMYPMKHQNSLKEWGLDPPKGIMFHGPPGTGKTLLAKALASELTQSMGRVTFYYQKGGECFSKWFGESEQKLRALFTAAKQSKPSIIFFDEIDGLCPNRETASQSSQAYAAIVASLLGLIDSVKRGEVFVIGATNRLDAVDPAIRRPGRFDKDLAFSLPEEAGRKHIIGIHTKNWTRDKPTDSLLDDIAKNSAGYTGADIEKLCGDAARAAMTRCGDINLDDVEVTRQDWATAIQNMHHSSTNVFGSTLFISKQPTSVMQPLINNILNEVLSQLEPLLPKERKGENFLQSLSRNSFLVWERYPSSEQFLNFALDGLLSHSKMNKIPTYILSDEVLLQGKTSLTETTKKIIQQATDSTKPCILYIPRVDALDVILKKYELATTFHHQLNSIRGQNILLLVTSLTPIPDMSAGIKDLFIGDRRSYKLRKPEAEERRGFFFNIFNQLIDDKDDEPPSPKKQKKVTNKQQANVDDSEIFRKHLKMAVSLTAEDEFEHLLRLYEALKRAMTQCTHCTTKDVDKIMADKEFTDILQRYTVNKLK